MIVIKAPAGFDPTWPAIPVDPTCPKCDGERCFHEERSTGGGDVADVITGYCTRCADGVLDLAALLGPKAPTMRRLSGGWCLCEQCNYSMMWPKLSPAPRCPECKVPQRVALAIETPCPSSIPMLTDIGPNPERSVCPDCAGSGVRLRVEYTAQVDAVVPIVTRSTRGLSTPFLRRTDIGKASDRLWIVRQRGEGVDRADLLALADWSPGRVAVLISEVYRWDGVPTHPWLRPFDGPTADLSEVLM